MNKNNIRSISPSENILVNSGKKKNCNKLLLNSKITLMKTIKILILRNFTIEPFLKISMKTQTKT